MKDMYLGDDRPRKSFVDEPIPEIYASIDNDLARDNLENDIPEADIADIEQLTSGSGGEDF